MRKCYATSLVVISWFLLMPPPVFQPVKDPAGDYKMNATGPIPLCLEFKPLKSEQACKAQLKKVHPYFKCVASDDPTLKNRAPAPASAPSISTISGAAGAHMQ